MFFHSAIVVFLSVHSLTGAFSCCNFYVYVVIFFLRNCHLHFIHARLLRVLNKVWVWVWESCHFKCAGVLLNYIVTLVRLSLVTTKGYLLTYLAHNNTKLNYNIQSNQSWLIAGRKTNAPGAQTTLSDREQKHLAASVEWEYLSRVNDD